MPDPIFAIGTTATIKEMPSGTPETLVNLRGITPYSAPLNFGNVTELADGEMISKPGRAVPGEITLSFTMTDETIATNQLTTLRTKKAGKKLYELTIDAPGAFDATTKPFVVKGYIKDVIDPAFDMVDEPMVYQMVFKVSAR